MLLSFALSLSILIVGVERIILTVITFPKLNSLIYIILPAFHQLSCVVHRLYQHEELSYLVVYVAMVPGNNTYLVFLRQEKSGLLFLLNDILLSLKPDTTESPTINTVPFFHTFESEMKVNQFGSLFSRACSDTQILFVSKVSRFLF